MRSFRLLLTSLASTPIVACQHRPIQVLSGCGSLPLLGGPSHAEVSRAQTRDSSALLEEKSGLFVTVRWSSDSLAKESPPVGAVVELSKPDGSGAIAKMVDSSGTLRLVLPEDGVFHLRVRRLAAWRSDTSFVLRHGYVDTVRVLLQYGGMDLCSGRYGA